MKQTMVFSKALISTFILALAPATAEPGGKYVTDYASFEKLTGVDVSGIRGVLVKSLFYGYQSAVDRDKTGGEPAYDYSVHLLYDREAGLYRLFSGGRWRRPGKGDGDHILQFVSKTGRGGTWKMFHDRPEFWLGFEEGKPKVWYASNTLEPEVLKVKGTYYMYTQVECDPGRRLDVPGVKATSQADRIQLFTSTDALTWKRFAKRGVVVHVDDPANTSFHHEEVIYVPWDADKKPFWMYVAVSIKGRFIGHVRMRTDDPRTFDWRAREGVSGLAQFGNQIGYIKDAPGGPLFVRITFRGTKAGRTVPTLEFSRDGLHWFFGKKGGVLLDGSKQNEHNRSCWFLGLSTIDGTGELMRVGPNAYHAIYGATTCNTPVAPDIFRSEIGVGDLKLFTIPEGRPVPEIGEK